MSELMNGKVVLVTGATSGIGKETAIGLAKMGASLAIVGRNDIKLTDVKKEIISKTGNNEVESMICDLSSLNEVRALAADFEERFDRLDRLINNAGLIVGDRKLTADGYEYTFALDHLSPFLLTNLLLGMLKKNAPSRVITISSEAHRFGKIHFEDIMLENGYTQFKAYSQAKLANIMFTYELARRLEGTGITSNCLHPGNVRTNFAVGTHGPFRLFWSLSTPFLLSAEKGARTSIYLASSPDVAGVSGQYFKRQRPARSSRRSMKRSDAQRLWEISAKLTGLDNAAMYGADL